MNNFSCPLGCNVGFFNREDLKNLLKNVLTSRNCPFCLVSCENDVKLVEHLDMCTVSNSNALQNVVNLMKHLNIGTVSNNNALQNLPPGNSSENNLHTNNQLYENYHDEDDDVAGYFCTVCKVATSDIYKHIQQLHPGQDVILQDDDESSSHSSDQSSIENENY